MNSHDSIGLVECWHEQSEIDLTPEEVRNTATNYRALVDFWTGRCGLKLERARRLIDNDVRAHLRMLALEFGEPTLAQETRQVAERLQRLVDGITARGN